MSFRFTQKLTSIFSPPFAGLPIFVWVYFVLCFFLHPESRILKGDFIDPDDYLYLVQTNDWLNGQSWFDNIQHRLNPPAGVPIHFSRLYELPLAILVLPFRCFFNAMDAATVAAVIFPLLMLAVFMFVLRWASEPFVGKDWSRITSFVLLFTGILIVQFAPGRVDHHGVVVMLSVAAFGCAIRMIRQSDDFKWAIGAGVLLALNLAIGLESLPVLILITAWIGWWAIVNGKLAARNGAVFGLILFLFSYLFLALTKPPANLFAIDTLAYSIVYVGFTGCIALIFVGIILASLTQYAWLRYVAGAGLSMVSGICFLHFFPDLKGGPYGGVDPALAKLMFDNIGEALPRIGGVSLPVTAICLLSPLLLMAALALVPAVKKAGNDYWLWGLLAVLFIDTGVLGAFYQARVLFFTLAFSTIWFAWFIKNGLIWAKDNLAGPSLAAARIGIVLLAGPIPMVVLPALHEKRSLYPDLVFFPVLQEEETCDLHPLAALLSSNAYSDHPHLIMNMINDGAELLFRTPDMVLAAPFHTNIAGNLDAARFFSTADQAEALQIVRNRKAEFVALCHAVPDLYRSPAAGTSSSLARQLADGHIPSWLNAIPLPGNVLLFGVGQE